MFEEIKIQESKSTFIIKVWLKNYELNVFNTTNKEEIFIECKGAWVQQPYWKNDLPTLLKDISWLIEEFQSEKKSTNFQIRLTSRQKISLEKNSVKYWFKTVSEFIKNKCELV